MFEFFRKSKVNYRVLDIYREIFQEEHFTFISTRENIEKVLHIIVYELRNPATQVESSLSFLFDYNTHARRFSFDVLNQGSHPRVAQEVQRVMNILETDVSRRAQLSSRNCHKLASDFIQSIRELITEVRQAFSLDNKKTNITKEQYARFIMDKREGLGGKYLFNHASNNEYVFTKKLGKLTREEIIIVLHLLLHPEQNKEKTRHGGWSSLGRGATPIRILMVGNKLFFLYRQSEHRRYDQQIQQSNKDITFTAY